MVEVTDHARIAQTWLAVNEKNVLWLYVPMDKMGPMIVFPMEKVPPGL